ncbi:putative inorganic phosphate cotransporter isoform X2 [Eurytemora carolleeae]|uniref:putative inorganic phosphate cotransporter isoform X2 n=1 Tax=Eurytemora carolleeae TaxID=1294199 RepID=UPI000C7703B4|nr:putative inorganic phosphate cotransporter isoform X2 [Eurytemora carolleeae]|eukprot:XP_023322825.1 putative inorganic phosphate cotransporter isoform X2 [Eurytemora affinis]
MNSDPEMFVRNRSSSEERGQEEPILQTEKKRCYQTRHLFAFMGFLGFANVYAMRVNLSVAIVAMVNSTALGNGSSISNNTCPAPSTPSSHTTDGPFNWNERDQGLILGAFFYGYVVTQLPGGRLAEIWGGKWLYGIGILVTAIFTMLTPLAAKTSVSLLTAVRVLEGLGEGVTYPAMHAMLSKWTPPNERSKMGSRVYSGSQFGTVIALPLSGYLADEFGWESVFYVFGVLSLIWFLAWAFLISDSPDTHPTISREERDYIKRSIGSARSSVTLSVPWKSILTSVPVWALVVTHMAQNWGFYTLLTELPTYMKNILHFDIKANAFISALPYLLMWLFALFISFLTDFTIDHNLLSRNSARKVFNSVAFMLPGLFLILAGYSGCNVNTTIVFLTLAGGINGAHYSGFMSTHLDMSPNFAGTLLGITNGFANIMGFLAPAFTGYIINGHQDLSHWQLVFFVAALVYFAGNVVFVVLGSTKEQPWNHNPSNPGDRNQADYEPISTSDMESD